MTIDLNPLRAMLHEDSQSIAQLSELLKTERSLLEKRQLDSMSEVVATKDRILGDLSFNAKQREQILKTAGLSTDLAGWELLLLKDPSTRSLIPDWQKLTEDFKACQRENDINGKMINRSKQTLSHLLNLLRGQVAAPSLYTQKGSTSSYSSGHTVAKA
jgi:flagellar biosynthesis protein FlgN